MRVSQLREHLAQYHADSEAEFHITSPNGCIIATLDRVALGDTTKDDWFDENRMLGLFIASEPLPPTSFLVEAVDVAPSDIESRLPSPAIERALKACVPWMITAAAKLIRRLRVAGVPDRVVVSILGETFRNPLLLIWTEGSEVKLVDPAGNQEIGWRSFEFVWMVFQELARKEDMATDDFQPKVDTVIMLGDCVYVVTEVDWMKTSKFWQVTASLMSNPMDMKAGFIVRGDQPKVWRDELTDVEYGITEQNGRLSAVMIKPTKMAAPMPVDAGTVKCSNCARTVQLHETKSVDCVCGMSYCDGKPVCTFNCNICNWDLDLPPVGKTVQCNCGMLYNHNGDQLPRI